MAVAAALAAVGFVFEYAIPGLITLLETAIPEAAVVFETLETGEVIGAISEASVGLGEGDGAIAGAVREVLPAIRQGSQAIGVGADVTRKGIHIVQDLAGVEYEETNAEKVFSGLSNIGSVATSGGLNAIRKLPNV